MDTSHNHPAFFKRRDRELSHLDLIGLYYRFLNRNKRFRTAIGMLFDRIDAIGLPERYEEVQTDNSYIRGQISLVRSGRLPPEIEAAERQELQVCWGMRRISRLLENFCGAWPLPYSGRDDLLWSCSIRRHERDRIRHGVVGGFIPMIGPLSVVSVDSGRSVAVLQAQPWVTVNIAERFEYHPVIHDREYLNAQVKAICKKVREQVVRQAADYERQVEQAGFTGAAPAYVDPDSARTFVYRLYLKAVKRLSWHQITVKEGRGIHRTTIAEQVRRLSNELGIPLPETGEQV